MDLQDLTINKILEARSSRWEAVKQYALDKGIPNENIDAFVDYIYSIKSGTNQLHVRKSCKDKLIQAIGEDGNGFNNISLTGFRDHSDLPNLDKAYEIIIKDLYDQFKETSQYENNDVKRARIDLQQGLLKARKILTDVLGTEYMSKNDRHPRIEWKDLGEHTLGMCYTRNNKTPVIAIHDIYKYNQELAEKYFMSTVIHEYIHSLSSCRKCSHGGEFKRIADLVTNNTSYYIDATSGPEEGRVFGNVLSRHLSDYK